MKITLKAWAEARYQPAPSMHTLRKWAREGDIHPRPELVGKTYYVDENARRLSADASNRPSLVHRMKAAA